MKKIVALLVLCFAFVAGTAFAACTDADIAAKKAAVKEQYKAYSAKNPDKAQEAGKAIKEKGAAVEAGTDKEAICTFYDNALKKLSQ